MCIKIEKNKLFLFLFLSTILILVELFVFLTTESDVMNFELFSLSVLLFFIITTLFILTENHFTPVVFFSVLIYGYVFSGIYFSFYDNFDKAKLFQFVDIDFTIESLIMSQISVIVGYLFLLFGVFLTKYIKVRTIEFEFKNFNINSKRIKTALIFLFLFGFLFWIYNSFKVANGPIDLLSKIGIFNSLLRDKLTTLPYHLSIIGSSLLFLHYLKKNYTMPIYVYFIILGTFLMLLSNARLSGAVFYLGSFFIMYSVYYKVKIDFKKLMYIGLFFSFLLAMFFFRYYSNLAYIEKSISISFIELFGQLFFAQTNIGDLQSITFAYQYTDDKGYLMGESFFDFTRFWIDRLFNINMESTSIGIRLKETYFSSMSGAPAPGIISEMIVNFGVFGISLGMLILGLFIGLISKLINPLKSKINLIIYVKFLFFMLALPKVDSSSIQGLILDLLPIFLFMIMVSVVYTMAKTTTHTNNIRLVK